MKNELMIRPANKRDLPAIVLLLAQDELGAKREDPSLPLDDRYTDAFSAIELDENQLLVVAQVAGSVVGCLQLSFVPGLSRFGMWRGQIESVRIASACRGQGYGRLVLLWAIDECRRRHCGLVQLTTDKSRANASRFYESLGFVASHEGMKLSLKLEKQREAGNPDLSKA